MKKLNKLQINPEKIMKNEELVTLRGGYGNGPCTCLCYNIYQTFGYLLSETGNCDTDCLYAFGHHATGWCTN
jgi:natural product precursor